MHGKSQAVCDPLPDLHPLQEQPQDQLVNQYACWPQVHQCTSPSYFLSNPPQQAYSNGLVEAIFPHQLHCLAAVMLAAVLQAVLAPLTACAGADPAH
jgi:hypothetical protein